MVQIIPVSKPTWKHVPQTLLFDADDTLWENNIYFERAIAAFITCLDHKDHSADEVRAHLNVVEHRTIAAHGYGLISFRRSLVQCFEELATVALTPAREREIVSFADAIGEQQIEVLPGVAAILSELSGRHRLMLVTKGDDVEQRDKLVRSGLANFFFAVEVVREKNVASYLEIIERYSLPAGTSWMIGNSPRSDINPAMAAALHAIYVPHGSTWILEHEEITPPPAGVHLLQLANLSELAEHF